MNKNAKKWVEDLRTTKELQAQGGLHIINNGINSFCCLGRACVLFIEAGNELSVKVLENKTTVYYGQDMAVLPKVVQDWLGLISNKGDYNLSNNCLSNDNDMGKTFVEIANIIEANKKELFIDDLYNNSPN